MLTLGAGAAHAKLGWAGYAEGLGGPPDINIPIFSFFFLVRKEPIKCHAYPNWEGQSSPIVRSEQIWSAKRHKGGRWE